MTTKTVSSETLTLIDSYLHFKPTLKRDVSIPIPYYNNRRRASRAQLRALVGKGNPQDIFDEVSIIGLKQKISPELLDENNLTNFLVEHSIGIDCSGLAYYLLNEESKTRGKGAINNRLKFPYSTGVIRSIRARMRPVENTGAKSFAHDSNSKKVNLRDIQPGDFCTMIGPTDEIGDHIIFFHEIEYQNEIPTILHYTHSIAWPADGQYAHGVRQGTITIVDIDKPIAEQIWTEKNTTGNENFTHGRAKESITEVRRLSWF